MRRFRKKISCDSFIRKCLERNTSVVGFRKYKKATNARERERERMRGEITRQRVEIGYL